jgi:hypothetical protein
MDKLYISFFSFFLLLFQQVFPQYQGGYTSEDNSFLFSNNVVCPIPVYITSAIYVGGDGGGGGAAGVYGITLNCNFPGFQTSAIFFGGSGSGSDGLAQIQQPACAVPVFILSDIYAGGIDSSLVSSAIFNLPSCNLPVYSVSDIYAGGIDSSFFSAIILNYPECGIPVFITSVIYAGGNDSSLISAHIFQFPECGIPIFVVTDIYSGGSHEAIDFSVLLKDCDVTVSIIDRVSQEIQYNVYPNPADQYMQIEINSGEYGILYMDVFDITGKTLLSDELIINQGVTAFQFSVNHFSVGVFFVKLTDFDGKSHVFKLLKN